MEAIKDYMISNPLYTAAAIAAIWYFYGSTIRTFLVAKGFLQPANVSAEEQAAHRKMVEAQQVSRMSEEKVQASLQEAIALLNRYKSRVDLVSLMPLFNYQNTAGKLNMDAQLTALYTALVASQSKEEKPNG